jgi:hypothetical protein
MRMRLPGAAKEPEQDQPSKSVDGVRWKPIGLRVRVPVSTELAEKWQKEAALDDAYEAAHPGHRDRVTRALRQDPRLGIRFGLFPIRDLEVIERDGEDVGIRVKRTVASPNPDSSR